MRLQDPRVDSTMSGTSRLSFSQRFSLGWSRARSAPPGRSSFWRRHGRFVLLTVVLTCAVFARPISGHARALALLLRLAGTPHAIAERGVVIDRTTLDDPGGAIEARLYVPTHQPLDGAPRAIVLAHGVHWLGIDEPRLVALAGSFARAGGGVLTPELAP